MFVTSCISIYVCCHVNHRIQLLKMAGEWKNKNYYGKVSRYVSFQLLNWGPSSIRITINSCKNMRCADLWIVAFDRRLHLSFSHILLVVVVDWKAPIKRITHKTGSYQQWQFDCFRFHIFFSQNVKCAWQLLFGLGLSYTSIFALENACLLCIRPVSIDEMCIETVNNDRGILRLIKNWTMSKCCHVHQCRSVHQSP